MNRLSKKVLPLAVLAVGFVGVAILIATRPQIEPQPQTRSAPLIEVVTVTREPVQLFVMAQGTVVPRTQSELVPQVSGEVIWVSPALVAGGFFEAGEPLLRIDPADYETELESARAALTRTQSEQRRARKERDRQQRLADRSVASQARIDDAENAYRVAEASMREARAVLGRAKRNLERTQLSAPYAGRVRSESADVGQFASRGSPLASLYAVDYAEVRLPLPDRELRYLNVPLGYRADDGKPVQTGSESGTQVTLRAEFAGRDHEWTGRIVRSEGEIDPRSRMVTLVARVENPYGDSRGDRHGASTRAPLAVGLFVVAEIRGLALPDALVIPRNALQGGDRVLVLDAESRLHFRDVEVFRTERDRVVLTAGLDSGELVCVSPMPGAIDGMRVLARDDGSETRDDGSETRDDGHEIRDDGPEIARMES